MTEPGWHIIDVIGSFGQLTGSGSGTGSGFGSGFGSGVGTVPSNPGHVRVPDANGLVIAGIGQAVPVPVLIGGYQPHQPLDGPVFPGSIQFVWLG